MYFITDSRLRHKNFSLNFKSRILIDKNLGKIEIFLFFYLKCPDIGYFRNIYCKKIEYQACKKYKEVNKR
jgi:hypothetical protein